MMELLLDVVGAGVPFLDSISAWEGAAQGVRAERWNIGGMWFGRAADFLLIAGQPDSRSERVPCSSKASNTSSDARIPIQVCRGFESAWTAIFLVGKQRCAETRCSA